MNRTRKVLIASMTIMAVVLSAAAFPATNAQSKSVTGAWKLTIESQNGTSNPSMTLKQEGEELTGTYKGRLGEAPLKGTVKGNDIKWTIKVNAQGNELQIDYTGTVDGDTMKGKVKFGDFGEGTFSGKKE
jgi:hypothetical protein